MSLKFFDNAKNFGYKDYLQVQALDLSSLSSARLNFSYAYAAREISTGKYHQDGLLVILSTDCGASFPHNNIVFERYGANLQSAGISNSPFIPSESSDWKRESIDIDVTKFSAAERENVQIAFVGVNGSGNNIYIDNIEVAPELKANDIGIQEVYGLPVVTCDNMVRPGLQIKNYGYEKIASVALALEANGQVFNKVFVFDSLGLGESKKIDMETEVGLRRGDNLFEFSIAYMNGVVDEQTANNSFSYISRLSRETDTIPVQEKFDKQRWQIANPDGNILFATTTIGENTMLSSNSFENKKIGKSYLISPTLNTSGYRESSIRFNYSYARRPNYNDFLRVLLSLDCGKTFSEELLALTAGELAVANSWAEWAPAEESDWRQDSIDISEHIGQQDIRIAFEFTNGGGNNLYLDNINVLNTRDPGLPGFHNDAVRVYPNPANGAFRISFNLSDKEEIGIQLISMSGQVVFDERFKNIVNQTLTINAPDQRGIYIVKVDRNGFCHTNKLMIRD